MVLTIKTLSIEGETAILALEGALDALGARQLKASCARAEEEGCTHLILDLSEVDLISSTGVGALLVAKEEFEDRGGNAFIAAPSPEVLSVLRCMDLDSVMDIVRDRHEARRRVPANSH